MWLKPFNAVVSYLFAAVNENVLIMNFLISALYNHRKYLCSCTHIFFIANSIKKITRKCYVVTIVMICSNLASLWKFQYFRRPIYNPVEHLWWSFNCKNSTSLNILKCSIIDACFGSKYASAFWRLFKRFISLNYFTLQDSRNLWFL